MALGQLADPRAVSALVHGLQEQGPRHTMAEALAHLGGPSVQPLIDLLNDPSTDVRLFSVEALGKLGDSRAIEPLIPLLGDEHILVRRKASEVLVKMGEPAVLPLIKALEDRDSLIRFNAAWLLGELGDERALSSLPGAAQADTGETQSGDRVKDAATTAIEKIKKRLRA